MNRPTSALCMILPVILAGCTSHSWTQITRRYAVSYDQVFAQAPEAAKKCGMIVTKSEPEAGRIIMNAHRLHEFLTMSVINLILGDEVIVKVTPIDPTTTEVFIDSRAFGQIGPDLGRTDRNVTALARAFDQLWPVVPAADQEERGEKRPGVSETDKSSHPQQPQQQQQITRARI